VEEQSVAVDATELGRVIELWGANARGDVEQFFPDGTGDEVPNDSFGFSIKLLESVEGAFTGSHSTIEAGDGRSETEAAYCRHALCRLLSVARRGRNAAGIIKSGCFEGVGRGLCDSGSR
jgi:hypothetical protein